MRTRCDLRLSFGAAGNSLGYLGGGWARAEAEFTWAVGAESHLVLPRLDPHADHILTIDVVPFVAPPALPAQRLIVSVNDHVLDSAQLSRPTLLGYQIPAGLLPPGDKVVITLQHPDAARPRDFQSTQDERQLALAVTEVKLHRVEADTDDTPPPAGLSLATPERPAGAADAMQWAEMRTGLSLHDLALCFESLGENCEFGLFQRRCGAEPLSLLRFSSTFMRNLVRGIETEFEGLGAPDTIEPRLEGGPPREYMVHEKAYGLVYHTFVHEGERPQAMLREQEASRLTFLRRKFLEDLALREKIFVYKHNADVSQAEILPLLMALSRNGAPTLLWVVPADKKHAIGTVEVVMPGLLRGYIDRFAPEHDAHALSMEGWLRVCANARVLAHWARQGGPRATPIALDGAARAQGLIDQPLSGAATASTGDARTHHGPSETIANGNQAPDLVANGI